MYELFEFANRILNGYVFAIAMLSIGGYFTVKLGFIQFKNFKQGIQTLISNEEKPHGLSPYKAAMIAIGGRLGTGNIVGVAIALTVGGPGSIFWLWISSIFAMAISFCESTLSQVFKSYDGDAKFMGGPMAYIERGLGQKYRPLALIYGFVMLFTVGFTYIIIHTEMITGTVLAFAGVESNFQLELVVSLLLIIISTYIISGGIKKIADYTAYIVPVMMISYIALGIIIAIENISYVPQFIITIVSDAFNPNAILGGGLVSTIVIGTTLSSFSNEAGQGIGTLAASLAEAKHPVEQGFANMITVFIDSVVICTLTAFLLMLASSKGVGYDINEPLIRTVMRSFNALYEGGDIMLLLFVVTFTFTSMITSLTYGIQELKNITKNYPIEKYYKVVKGYIAVVMITILISPFISIRNEGISQMIMIEMAILMTIINMFALIKLRKVIFATVKHYETNKQTFKIKDIGIDDEETVWK